MKSWIEAEIHETWTLNHCEIKKNLFLKIGKKKSFKYSNFFPVEIRLLNYIWGDNISF